MFFNTPKQQNEASIHKTPHHSEKGAFVLKCNLSGVLLYFVLFSKIILEQRNGKIASAILGLERDLFRESQLKGRKAGAQSSSVS